jgi:hypothetical protein
MTTINPVLLRLVDAVNLLKSPSGVPIIGSWLALSVVILIGGWLYDLGMIRPSPASLDLCWQVPRMVRDPAVNRTPQGMWVRLPPCQPTSNSTVCETNR